MYKEFTNINIEERESEHQVTRIVTRTANMDDFYVNWYWVVRGYGDLPAVQNQICARHLIYRDTFIISYNETKQSTPAVNHPMAQNLDRIIENSKKLVDLRFPK